MKTAAQINFPQVGHSEFHPAAALPLPAGEGRGEGEQQRWFFDSPKAQEALAYHATRWLGTPFHPHAAVMGAGVDCVSLIAHIYIACGFLTEFNPPKYSMDGGKHNAQSQLIAWLESNGQFIRRPCHLTPDTSHLALPGDTLCFKFRSQSEHHAGLKLGGSTFIHCLERRRVEIASLKDHTYARTLTAVYRPLVLPLPAGEGRGEGERPR